MSREVIMRAGKRKEGGILLLLTLPLMIKKFWGKDSQEQKEDIVLWIIWIKIFRPTSSFKKYLDY